MPNITRTAFEGSIFKGFLFIHLIDDLKHAGLSRRSIFIVSSWSISMTVFMIRLCCSWILSTHFMHRQMLRSTLRLFVASFSWTAPMHHSFAWVTL